MNKKIIAFLSILILNISANFCYGDLGGCGFRDNGCCYAVWYDTDTGAGVLMKINCSTGEVEHSTGPPFADWFCKRFE